MNRLGIERRAKCPEFEVRCVKWKGVFRGATLTLTPASSAGQALALTLALSHDGRGEKSASVWFDIFKLTEY